MATGVQKHSITPGPWERIGFGVWGANKRRLAIAEIDNGSGVLKVQTEQEAVANMDLFAEAGTVANETGLTPRQLVVASPILWT